MKVYTKTGRKEHRFWRNQSPQNHIRIESYGTVDELNSYIGLVRDQEMNAHYKDILAEIQDRLTIELF
jgi:cob(I)alamin adenosyltransferase